MLQRYLDTSARLEVLRAAVDTALTDPLPDGGGGNGKGDNSSNDVNGEDAGGSVHNGSTPGPKVDTGGDSNGAGGGTSGNITSRSKGSKMAGSSVLTAQLQEAGAILSRELGGLSEGDMLLIWERCVDWCTLEPVGSKPVLQQRTRCLWHGVLMCGVMLNSKLMDS